MGEIYSKLDQHNRRVIREELESVLGEVSLQEVKQNTNSNAILYLSSL